MRISCFYEASNRGANVALDVVSQYLRMALWSLPPLRKHTAFYDIRAMHKRHPDWFREDLTSLVDLLAAGRLQPVIAERIALDDVVKAHQMLERAVVQGKRGHNGAGLGLFRSALASGDTERERRLHRNELADPRPRTATEAHHLNSA